MLLKPYVEPLPVLHVAVVPDNYGLVIHGVPDPLQGGDLVLFPLQAIHTSGLLHCPATGSSGWWQAYTQSASCRSTFLARPARGP